jgi:hypothetical protein
MSLLRPPSKYPTAAERIERALWWVALWVGVGAACVVVGPFLLLARLTRR